MGWPIIPEFPSGYFENKTDLILNLLKCYLPDCIIYPQVKMQKCHSFFSWNFSLKGPDGERGSCKATYWLISKRLEFFQTLNKEMTNIDEIFLDADL